MKKSENLPQNIHRDFYQQLRRRLEAWVHKNGDDYQYADYLMLAPDLVHLLAKLIIDRRISVESRGLLALAIAYFISPADFIPEGLIGPTGYIDDVVVAVFALNRIINEDNKAVVREHWAGSQDILKVIQEILKLADDMIGSGAWSKIKTMFDDASSADSKDNA